MDIDPHTVAGEKVTRDQIRVELEDNGAMRVDEIAVRVHPEPFAILFDSGHENLKEWEWHRVAVGATLIRMKADGDVWEEETGSEDEPNPKYMSPLHRY